MSLQAFGLGLPRVRRVRDDHTEQMMPARPLHRVLAFTRRSIDDVVNDPIAKREVFGYYKVHKLVERRGEILELERQWNG